MPDVKNITNEYNETNQFLGAIHYILLVGEKIIWSHFLSFLKLKYTFISTVGVEHQAHSKEKGNKDCILIPGLQKTPEKRVPSKLPQKNKTVPEKTKFTLQYNTVNGHAVKKADEKGLKSLTPQGSRILRSTRAKVTLSEAQEFRGKATRDQTRVSETDTKKTQLRDEQKISSLPFLRTPVVNSKSNSAPPRSSAKTPIKTQIPTHSKISFPQSERCTGSNVQKSNAFRCNTELKTGVGKVKHSERSATSSSAKEFPEKPSVNPNLKTPTGRTPSKNQGTEAKSPRADDKTSHDSSEKDGRYRFEENGKAMAIQRSRSQEVKRNLQIEKSAKQEETAQRKRSEGKIHGEIGKKLPFSRFGEKNWETGSVALESSEKTSPTIASQNLIKENVIHSTERDSNSCKTKLNLIHDGNQGCWTAQSSPTEGDISDSLERTHRDEELLSLDKRIWSNLEVQIKETCEKTDFLYDSGDDSGESISDIIHQLFSNREDEDLIQCYKMFEGGKCPDYKEEWNSLRGARNKVKVGPCGRFHEKEIAKAETEMRDNLERPKSRRGTEEPFGRKIGQDSKRIKSSEDSKLQDKKQEFRTKSLSGDIKLTNGLGEDSRGKPSKDRKTVNFQENKFGSNFDSSSFFHTHQNVGFIGKDMDEEYVSFEPGQVTLYQPHEGQMLLYDIANCAATQGYLKMCGITYDVEERKNAEQMSPSGRVPFISSSLCIIPEFEAIVSFMQYKKFACIPVRTSDKSAFRSIISMIVDELETAERYICWNDDRTLLNYTRPRIGRQYPFPLNHIMHWKKRNEERGRLTERGYLGRSLDSIFNEINSCFRALSRRLGNNNFFFGRVGTEVDALVYGHVYALFTTEVDGPLRDLQFLIQQYPNLVSFACNFDKVFSLDKFSSIQQFYWDNIVPEGSHSSQTSFTIKV